MRILNRIGVCTGCPQHILIQPAEHRSVRAQAAVAALAALAAELYTFHRFGWL